ncbi:hypothetical protein ACFLZ6_01825 [Nanoarchaeota archaeon]
MIRMFERVTEYTNDEYGRGPFPVRVVREHVRARHDIGMQLTFAAQDLGVGSLDIQLMPYVLVVGRGVDQIVHPLAATKERFADDMKIVQHGRSFIKDKDCIEPRYVKTLYEYGLEDTSVLVNGTLQGMVVPPYARFEGDKEPNFEIPVYFELYGPTPYDTAKLFVEPIEHIDPHDLRRPIDESLQERIRAALDSNDVSIVTLGLLEDFSQIMSGQSIFVPGSPFVQQETRHHTIRYNQGEWTPRTT